MQVHLCTYHCILQPWLLSIQRQQISYFTSRHFISLGNDADWFVDCYFTAIYGFQVSELKQLQANLLKHIAAQCLWTSPQSRICALRFKLLLKKVSMFQYEGGKTNPTALISKSFGRELQWPACFSIWCSFVFRAWKAKPKPFTVIILQWFFSVMPLCILNQNLISLGKFISWDESPITHKPKGVVCS